MSDASAKQQSHPAAPAPSYADTARPAHAAHERGEECFDVPLTGEFDPANWERRVFFALHDEHFNEYGFSAEGPGIFTQDFRHNVFRVVEQMLASFAEEQPCPSAEKLADAISDLMLSHLEKARRRKKKREAGQTDL